MIKKWLIIGLSAGAGFALMGAALIAGAAWWSARPTPWDSLAVSVVTNEADEIYNEKFVFAAWEFRFGLQNNTNRDITIPGTARVLRRLKNGSVLDELSSAKVEGDTFIPAGQRAQMTLHFDWSCKQIDEKGVEHDRDLDTCFQDTFADSESFVVFDGVNHLQIHLPKPQRKFAGK